RRGGEQEAGRAAGARRRGRGRAAPRAPPRPRGPADADAIRLRTAAGATAGRIPVTLIQRRAGHHITWAAGAARLTARRRALRKTRSGRALSSAGERSLHTGEGGGSIPTAPTIQNPSIYQLKRTPGAKILPRIARVSIRYLRE